MLTDITQKTVLFDEASASSLKRFQVSSIPEVYLKLYGSTRGSVTGAPITTLYEVDYRSVIKPKEISDFFVGLTRDYNVGHQSVEVLKEKLSSLRQEFWMLNQNIRNRAIRLKRDVESYANVKTLNGSWVLSDALDTTTNIDILNSTAWVDTSVGEASPPLVFDQFTEYASNAKIDYILYGPPVDFLGSQVSSIFDGVEGTSWRGLFSSPESIMGATVRFNEPLDIAGLQLDPVGYGVDISVEFDTGSGYKPAIKQVIYSKTTIGAASSNVLGLRVLLRPTNGNFPKAVGLRNVKIYKGTRELKSELRTTTLSVTSQFSSIRLDLDATTPPGSDVKAKITFSDGEIVDLPSKTWVPIVNDTNKQLSIQANLLQRQDPYFVASIAEPPLNTSTGSLWVGKNQVFVTAAQVSLDSASLTTQKGCWFSVPTINERTYVDRLYIKPDLPQTTSVVRGANILPFQYTVEGEVYKDFALLLNHGGEKSVAQKNYTYKLEYKVFASKDTLIPDSKFFFLQGVRNRALGSFTNTGKVYGSVTLTVNGDEKVSSSRPFTVYSTEVDGSYIEGGIAGFGTKGTQFELPLMKGWNTVSVEIKTVDPALFITDDPNEVPYLQAGFYPSLFDSKLQADVGITSVVANGEIKPTTDFSLLWEKDRSLLNWAWDTEFSSLLFNTNKLNNLDGYLVGEFPNMSLVYESAPTIDAAKREFYLTFSFSQRTNLSGIPVLSGYTLYGK